MNYLPLLLLLVGSHCAFAQGPTLKADESIPIPKVSFDETGDLLLTASSASSVSDSDFLVGKWKMHDRHLNERLANSHEWTEFNSTDENSKILAGNADMDTYSTREFPGQEGNLFEGLTLRLFDPKTRLWSLYWVASNTGKIDPPVVGSFANGIGHFLPKTHSKAAPSSALSLGARNKERPVWGQAFSADRGKTWEWNFFNVSERP